MSPLDPPPGAVLFAPIHLVPAPRKMVPYPGFFRLGPQTSVAADPAARTEAAMLAAQIVQATGFPCPVVGLQEPRASQVVLRLDAEMSSLGREACRLRVTPDDITITAAQDAGLFYGVQTLLQLLPAEIWNDQAVDWQEWTVPCVEIEDAPRFAWRGAMLDVSRHFLPPAFLRRFLDLLALHKMNTLQLHLTDDQGWRIEIKKYPRLTEVGARRTQTLVGYAPYSPTHEKFDPRQEQFDGVPHGGFYTQDEMRALVDYARQRHITLVPEIEMPGHAQAAVAAYPAVGCTDAPMEVSPRWGIHDALFNPSATALGFLQDVLTEILDIFPSPYIHIGGDEAIKTQWKNSPQCRQLMRERGLPDEAALQSYFVGRMDDFLSRHGRILVGWDEIREGGLSPHAVVMSWRGEEGGVTAAREGHDVVMAPYGLTYFDYYQSDDYAAEPLAFPETLTLPMVYGYDPMPAALPEDAQPHILGAQCQLWTEYMPSAEQVEYMAFPRLSAFSEVVWSNPERNFAGFTRRLRVHLTRLDALHVRYRPLDPDPVRADGAASVPEKAALP